MKKVLTTALIVALAACAQSDVTVQAPEQNPSTTGLTDPEPGPEREPEPELDPSLLELTLAEVTAGPVGDEASFTINDRIAEIDVDEEAELVLEVVSGPEPTQREGRFVVPLVAPHATLEYRAFVQTLSATGEALSVVLETANSAPTLEAMSATSFALGEATTVSAMSADLDDDDVVCSIAFAEDNTGPLFALPPPSDTCAFIVFPPSTNATWRLAITARDDFGGATRRTITIAPGNTAPVVAPLEVDGDVTYACDTSCASEDVAVVVEATDDNDASGALVVAMDVASTMLPEGARVEIDEHVAGTFAVRVVRDDVGALAGTATLTVTVTDVTHDPAQSPGSSEVEFVINVDNEAPAVFLEVTPEAAHTFDGRYRASIDAAALATDREDNAMLDTVVLCGKRPVRRRRGRSEPHWL